MPAAGVGRPGIELRHRPAPARPGPVCRCVRLVGRTGGWAGRAGQGAGPWDGVRAGFAGNEDFRAPSQPGQGGAGRPGQQQALVAARPPQRRPAGRPGERCRRRTRSGGVREDDGRGWQDVLVGDVGHGGAAAAGGVRGAVLGRRRLGEEEGREARGGVHAAPQPVPARPRHVLSEHAGILRRRPRRRRRLPAVSAHAAAAIPAAVPHPPLLSLSGPAKTAPF